MSLLKMSLSGAIIILVIVLIRALAINIFPKKTFLVLWGIAVLRLVIPFSIPTIFSAYSVITNSTSVMQAVQNSPVSVFLPTASTQETPTMLTFIGAVETETYSSIWLIVWATGVFSCFAFFLITYIRSYKRFQYSLPIENSYVNNWLEEHQSTKRIIVRQTSVISAPLTYGFIRPTILMPKNIDCNDTKLLKYILMHEYVHIRRFDVLKKLLLTLTLCLHWFNPLVWTMYILANRDIELSCDEAVIRYFGEETKSIYARLLISMEEAKSGLTPLCNNFSKTATEERIIAIMKIKKYSLVTTCAAVALVMGVAVVFATSAATPDQFFTSSIEEEAELIMFAQDFVNDFNGTIAGQSSISLSSYIGNDNLLAFAEKMITITQKQDALGMNAVIYDAENEFNNAECKRLQENFYYVKVPFGHDGSYMLCQLVIEKRDTNLAIVDFYFGTPDGVDTISTGHHTEREIGDPTIWNDEKWVMTVYKKLFEYERELQTR